MKQPKPVTLTLMPDEAQFVYDLIQDALLPARKTRPILARIEAQLTAYNEALERGADPPSAVANSVKRELSGLADGGPPPDNVTPIRA